MYNNAEICRKKMKTLHLVCTSLTCLTLMLSSCNSSSEKKKENNSAESSSLKTDSVVHRHVLSLEEQAALSPEDVLKQFLEGNERFRNSNVTLREHNEEIRKTATGGQFPKAVVISCLDSRVPVEDVFDQGIGDVFVGRVAGNFVNTDLLGSLEFACKVAGAKLILVMGHQHCGAVKGAIDDVQVGNITSMLKNIKPAVIKSEDFTGEKSSKNEAYVRHVAENNVRNALQQIREKSEILREMENKGQIKIVGAFYTLRTGNLKFIE
jgi:carbonic anhydrase